MVEGADYLVDDHGCWIWQGKLTPAGYPERFAHRQSWEEVNGPRPEGWHVHHKCYVTTCINPEHLVAVSPEQHFELHWLEGKGISRDDLHEIRRLGTVPGVRAVDVGERYGIHIETVYRCWRGHGWEWVLGEDRERCVVAPYACARPGCTQPVVGKKRHAKYCSPRCRSRDNDRKRVRPSRALASGTNDRSDDV